jgi:hypothetical protein
LLALLPPSKTFLHANTVKAKLSLGDTQALSTVEALNNTQLEMMPLQLSDSIDLRCFLSYHRI